MPNEVVRLKSIPTWDERWPREQLVRRRNIARRAFGRGFQMRAYTDDELTFPSFGACEIPGILPSFLRQNGWRAFTGVDLSSKKRKGNAISTVLVDDANRRYLADIRFGAWRSRAMADQIEDVVQTWKPIIVMVENNGYQDALLDWISDCKRRYHFWTILEPTTTTSGNKYDAELGLPGLELEFSNRAWTFPLSMYDGIVPDEDGPEEEPSELVGREAFRRLGDEFRFHPFYRTSDGVMATLFARQGIEMFSGYDGSHSADLESIRHR